MMSPTINLKRWDRALAALRELWAPGATSNDHAVHQVLRLVPHQLTPAAIHHCVSAAIASISEATSPELSNVLLYLGEFRWTQADVEWVTQEAELYRILATLFSRHQYTKKNEFRTDSVVRASPKRARALLDTALSMLKALDLDANQIRLEPPYDAPWGPILEFANRWLSVPGNMIPEKEFRLLRKQKAAERADEVARLDADQRELFREHME